MNKNKFNTVSIDDVVPVSVASAFYQPGIRRWLVDTGCPCDLIAKRELEGNEASFIKKLVQISQDLINVQVPQRLPVLKRALEELNQDFPATVYIPLCSATDVSICQWFSFCDMMYLSVCVYVRI